MFELNKGKFAFIFFACCGSANGDELPQYLARANFDTQALEANGLNPALADYYAYASRFSPGKHIVTLSINGKKSGLVTIQFDKQGQLCAEDHFLSQARIKKVANSASEQCPDLTAMWSGTIVDLDPDMQEVQITLPPSAMDYSQPAITSDYSGGVAGLLNYNGFAIRNSFDGEKSDRFQGSFQLGFNIGDWIFRSTQLVSHSSESSFSYDSLYTYAQRTFSDYGKLLQMGEINVTNTRFSIPTINGFQWIPDNSLSVRAGSGINVTGIARTNQAQVEVRQGGVLIYSTLVPSGPFTLPDMPVISGNTDLDVTVKENDGSQQHTVVSASTFRSNQLNRESGFSFAGGKVKQLNSRFTDPWVLAMSKGWGLTQRLYASSGMLMADNHYYGFSGTLDMIPVPNFYTSLGYLGSIDNRSQTDGQKVTLDASYALPWNLGISVGSSYATRDFRQLTDIYGDNNYFSPMKYESNIGLSWSHEIAGGFSLNYYRGQAWNSGYDSNTFSTTWFKSFGRTTLNVSWQSNVNRGRNDNEDMFYVSLSVPLGPVSTVQWMRHRQSDTTWGTRLSGSLSQNNQYSLGMEKRLSDNDVTSLSAALNSNLRYTNLSLSADMDDQRSRTLSATLQGGVVAHAHGVTFSPYSVDDTFGTVSLDKPIAGVEIQTSRGSVWTDKWGQAVVPSLPPYRNSALDLNTESLPANIDVNNGKAILNVSRGAVARWRFTTLSQRRVMMTITQSDGSKLPAGSAIVNQAGEYVTTAPDNGVVFLNDAVPGQQLYALTNGKRCALNYTLPQAELDTFYDEVKGTCR